MAAEHSPTFYSILSGITYVLIIVFAAWFSHKFGRG